MCLKFILILIVTLVIFTSADEAEDFRPDTRIINGFTPCRRFANRHVVLLYIQLAKRKVVCSGSLISSQWVVTAGDCGSGASSIEVHLGVFNRSEPVPQKINVTASQIFVHPKFKSNATVTINNIALLQLNPRAKTSLRSIRPIPFVCPSASSFAGRASRTCGWGITSDTAKNITTVLKCVDMPLMTNTPCKRKWKNKNVVNSKNICTSVVASRTACHGDSGGPLVVNTGLFLRPKLVGTVSYGDSPCETAKLPNVFTRISAYSSWISRITKLFCVFL